MSDDLALAEMRRVIRARAADHIAEIVRNARPPTPEQIAHLRRLFPPPSREQAQAIVDECFPDGIPYGDGAAG